MHTNSRYNAKSIVKEAKSALSFMMSYLSDVRSISESIVKEAKSALSFMMSYLSDVRSISEGRHETW